MFNCEESRRSRMRLNDEGLYFPPTDIMYDVMKLKYNIITECGGEILFIME